MDMNILKTEIKTINWSHLSPRNAEIMARWEVGQTYREIADVLKITRSTVSSVVRDYRNDDHVVTPRGPIGRRIKRSYSRQGLPNMYGGGFRDDFVQKSAYEYSPIIAYRQIEVDQKIESRTRLLAALKG